mgnify:CR=1 FL=1
MFIISVVVLRLEAPRAYPLLLGRPWLWTTSIKQHWQCNMISFRGGKTKARLITEEHISTPQNTTPLYSEGVHILDGLADEEVDHFLEEHPTITPLFKIDVMPAIGSPNVEVATEEALNQA